MATHDQNQIRCRVASFLYDGDVVHYSHLFSLRWWPMAALFVMCWWPGLSALGQSSDVDDGQRLVQQLSLADWMGPLAPVALSPFFGLMCLSGASIMIEHGLMPDHLLLSGNPALQNENVFFALLALTALTSLPRLTKVTKPFAQLADLLETYAGVVFMLVVHAAAQPAGDATSTGLVLAGFVDTSAWIFMAVVTFLNILVIQTVRLFFEMLVWLSPIPLLDALFEAINKIVCLVLVAIYLFHPGAALVVNLVLFALCLLVVRSAHRQLKRFREAVLLPIWRRVTAR